MVSFATSAHLQTAALKHAVQHANAALDFIEDRDEPAAALMNARDQRLRNAAIVLRAALYCRGAWADETFTERNAIVISFGC